MLTVEVGLSNSNPIDPVPTVYIIQMQSYRNLGQTAGAVTCPSVRRYRRALRLAAPLGPRRRSCRAQQAASPDAWLGLAVVRGQAACDGPRIPSRHDEYIR